METRSFFPSDLEIRRRGGRSSIRGRFPYRKKATISDRGKQRKESFYSRAFRFSVESPKHDIHLLLGHSFDQPLASKLSGSLTLTDSADGLSFRAELPQENLQPSWMRDAVLSVETGLATGISPGFRIPPKSVVPDAERLIPEEGNPGVYIREIREAVLFELSLVSRPAYQETELALREKTEPEPDPELERMRELALWL